MRWLFRYSILWIPAVALIAAACGNNGMCACSYVPTQQICDEPAVTQTAEVVGTQVVYMNQTAAAVEYPTYPPMPIVTASNTPSRPATTPPSAVTPTHTPTLMPPDPNVFRTPTPIPPTPSPGPSGLPLRVTDIRADGGACYVAVIDGQCYWQEVRRALRADGGLIIMMATGCSPHLEATFDVERGVVTVSQIVPVP